MNPEQVFERNFKERMINKDFQSFKKSFPTLCEVIEVSLYQVHNYSYCEGFNDAKCEGTKNQIEITTNKKPT